MYHDLSLSVSDDKQSRQTTYRELTVSAFYDGYAAVASNYETSVMPAVNSEIPNPKAISDRELDNHTSHFLRKQKYESSSFSQFTRLTITLDDHKMYQQFTAPKAEEYFKKFDILAVKPKAQIILQNVCAYVDCDIISFDLSERMPVQLKRPQVNQAVSRGIMFELTYSSGFKDRVSKRMMIANALQIVEATKGKNLIISSGALDAFSQRSPNDVINLGIMFGMTQDQAKRALVDNPKSVLKHAAAREIYKSTVQVLSTSDIPEEDKWKIPSSDQKRSSNGEESKKEEEEEKKEEMDLDQ